MNPVQKPKSATFRGKRWRVLYASPGKGYHADVQCPDKPRKRLRLRPNLTDFSFLEAAIHESLHACLWDLDEEAVEETGRDIARFLWKLGYRREDKDD